MEKDQEQQNESADAMRIFLGEFGEMDVYTKITLEEFFKAIINGK